MEYIVTFSTNLVFIYLDNFFMKQTIIVFVMSQNPSNCDRFIYHIRIVQNELFDFWTIKMDWKPVMVVHMNKQFSSGFTFQICFVYLQKVLIFKIYRISLIIDKQETKTICKIVRKISCDIINQDWQEW